MWGTLKIWPCPLTNGYSRRQCQPALVQKTLVQKSHERLKWRPYKVTGLFSMSIQAKKTNKQKKWPTWLRARAFYGQPKAALRHFHPSGEPTHLPASHLFCSHRTCLQGKIPQVTSPAEILTTTEDVISS